ncbi:PREDICTED: vacuolar protein sorting-associated protein 11 homolog [Papilio polytes]|uniref:vacuolar protein sorting-associated protein 11 homolog n=1 Tax=Papilio polytes TaxID=76194 RepID=UPI00067612F1|nr:PREDICTED: vacuolar protein sorting-associated protein 11 homolog [Papilio polytes]
MIKVWDWSRNDRDPTCTRVSRAVPSHLRATPATALAVHNKNLFAVGFQDGAVSLFRGDISRQRSGKMRTLPDSGTSPITGLAFKGADKLFVVSRSATLVYRLCEERCVTLDAMGAAPHCSVLAERQCFTVAATDAIYCYTAEVRGPCYALAGEKVLINWFRNYLIIVTNEIQTKNTPSTSATANKSHHLTVLDIQNKFIVFSKTFDGIEAVLTEWGSFYILTKNKEMIYLEEKDLQSKLSLLFKKNLYDVAIRIASSQHYDVEGLMEIYKQYGDHLYSKGDLKSAIEQYVKTIGWLETSYVIRKYLESRHLESLVQYLEELHKKGFATEDHTTLLLTCYVKIDQHDQQGKLKEFINSKDKAIDFDVDVAIKVVRQVSVDDALSLAANHKRHDWYLKIVLEDKKGYNTALDYISDLEFDEADMYMKKYGHKLIQHEPKESTKLLKLLCTDYKPRSKPLVDEDSLSGVHKEPDRAVPDEYIHMFLNNSEHLIEFLEHMVSCSDLKCSSLVYNTLIEHYIHVWAKTESEDKTQEALKVYNMLKDPEANYDRDQMLIICQMFNFKIGILHLYEEKKLWRATLALHMRSGTPDVALEVCRRRGAASPQLWRDLLHAAPPPPPRCLHEPLHHLASEKLLSPILVIDCLTSTESYTLGDVRTYLMDVLKAEEEVINRERELSAKYKSETEKMKKQIEVIQNEPITFQSSRCAACNGSLTLPSVHFFCQHSFHQHCFESYSECESECPACAACAAPRPPAPPHHAAETLHSRLHKEHDPYAVVSEYFGRGLFNKLTVVTEGGAEGVSPAATPPAPAAAPTPPSQTQQTYGPGAEAKLRLQEGQSKQVYVSSSGKQAGAGGAALVPVAEGRMRLLEQQQYSSSLEANLQQLRPRRPSPAPSHTYQDVSMSPKISSAISNGANKNPFEDDTYDESMNPFCDEEAKDSSNPFAEDDDYDKNLNPFS